MRFLIEYNFKTKDTTKLFVLASLLFISYISQSATFTSTQSGNWNTGSTWGNEGNTAGVDYPSSTDDVTIANGYTVTIPYASYTTGYNHSGNIDIKSNGTLISEAGNSSDGLSITDGKLSVSGTLTVGRGASGGLEADLAIKGSGKMDVYAGASVLIWDDLRAEDNAVILIESGVCVDVKDDYMHTGTNAYIGGAGSISIGPTSGTHNVQYSNGAGTGQLASGFTVLRESGGTPCAGSTVSTGTGNFELGTYYSQQNGDWSSASTWTMDAAGTIPATFPPLSINNVVINHDVDYTQGTAYAHSGDITVGSSGRLDMDNGTSSGSIFEFVGDNFNISGTLTTTRDFANQMSGTGGTLRVLSTGHMDIGDDFHLEGSGITILENTVCINVADDVKLYDTNHIVCGVGSISVGPNASQNVFSFFNSTSSNQYCSSVLGYSGSGADCSGSPIFQGTGGAILPIDLVSFKAKKLNGSVLLQWSTASEINNDYFTIERSTNGSEFEDIETVLGAGNSNSILNYSFVDNNLPAGNVYYRLKQTDFDGSETYSEIVMVVIEKESLTKDVNLFPNPTAGLVNISFSQPDVYNVVVTDITGKSLTSYQFDSVTNNSGTIDLSDLQNGIYLVHLITDNSRIVRKIELTK